MWNPEPSFGKLWTEEDFQEFLKNASKPYISGITLLGGDPFHPVNREEILNLSKPWVGSENQRVINVPESLKKGKIILL